MTPCPKCSHDASDHGAYTCWRGCGCGMHIAPSGAWCETTVPIPEHRCPESDPAPSTVEGGDKLGAKLPSPPAETAPQCACRHPHREHSLRHLGGCVGRPGCPCGPDCRNECVHLDCDCREYEPVPAPAAPEVDLGEVPALLDALDGAIRAMALCPGVPECWRRHFPEVEDAREAVEAAVRSLVERARREGREDAVDVIHRAAEVGVMEPRHIVARIRALTPAVPGAAPHMEGDKP